MRLPYFLRHRRNTEFKLYEVNRFADCNMLFGSHINLGDGLPIVTVYFWKWEMRFGFFTVSDPRGERWNLVDWLCARFGLPKPDGDGA